MAVTFNFFFKSTEKSIWILISFASHPSYVFKTDMIKIFFVNKSLNITVTT